MLLYFTRNPKKTFGMICRKNENRNVFNLSTQLKKESNLKKSRLLLQSHFNPHKSVRYFTYFGSEIIVCDSNL